MNVEQYQQLLYGLQTNPQQTSEIIMQMSQEDILSFFELNLLLLSQTQNKDLIDLIITLIYRFSKNHQIFNVENAPQTFWPNFAQIIPTVFESPIFSETSKNLVSLIISLFASYFFTTIKDTQIQNFLLALLTQSPQFETYIITSISETIISSQEYGGFAPDILLQFCAMPLQFPNSIIPRLKLYFVFSMRFFSLCDEEDQSCAESKQLLVSLFPELLKQTPVEFLGKFISTTALFVESFATLFEEHIPVFIPMLCAFAANQECPFRNQAIFCIESFSVGSINICSSFETYYQPVLKCLIGIMAEINEQSPVKEELNDDSSYIIAQHASRTFLESCINLKVYHYLVEYFNETVSQFSGGEASYEKVPWPIMYSFIFSFSYYNSFILDTDDTDGTSYTTERIQLLSSFLPYLTIPEAPPHIKIAIYDMINLLAQQTKYTLYDKAADILMPVLFENTLNETNEDVQLACISAFAEVSTCVKKFRFKEEKFDLKQSFAFLMENLGKFQHRLLPYFLTILKYFLHYQIEAADPRLFAAFAEAILALYNAIKESCGGNVLLLNSDDVEIICRVFTSLIEAFILPSQEFEVNKKFFDSIEGLPEQAAILMDDCLLLLLQEKVMDEKHLKSAILKCIRFLAENALPIIDKYKLFDMSIESCKKDYEILQFGQFDSIEDRGTALIKIDPGPESSMKCFLYKNDHDEICYSLKLLIRIIDIALPQLDPSNIETLVEICQTWITNTYHIEKVKNRCYGLLFNLCISLKVMGGEFQPVSKIIIEDFCDDLDKGSISFKTKILIKVHGLFHDELVDPEQVPKVLESIVLLTEQTLADIKEINADLFKYNLAEPTINEEQMPQKVNRCRNILYYVSRLFFHAMKHYPDQSIPFMKEVYLPKLFEYMKEPESFEFSLDVIAFYVSRVSDIQFAVQLIDILMSLALENKAQLSSKAFILFVKIFNHVQLPVELLAKLTTFFCEILMKMIDNYPDNDLDLAICSFASFILKFNPQLVQLPPTIESDTDEAYLNLFDQAVSFYLLAFPYEDYNNCTKYSLLLIVQLFQKRNKFIMDECNFSRIMGWITSNINSKDLMVGFETAFKKIIKQFNNDFQTGVLSPKLLSDFTEQGWNKWNSIVESEDPPPQEE